MKPQFLHALVLTLLAAVVLGTAVPRASAGTDEDVDRAIEQLKAFLYRAQGKLNDGRGGDAGEPGWFGAHDESPKTKVGGHNGDGGPTAIALLALIMSGESSQDPRIAGGLRYMRGLEMTGTYALSLRMHAWSYLPDSYKGILETDTEFMLAGAHPQRSTWSYVANEVSNRLDHSTSQYGALAMWQSAKRGARLPATFWKNAEDHYIKAQYDDGAWSYNEDPSTKRATMTCAGLTVLYVVQQELYRGADSPNTRLTAALDKGIEWMNRNWSANASAHGGNGYYMYGVERVGLASGLKFFRNSKGDHDWFKQIATVIAKNTGNDGSGGQIVNSSFYLMFLSRGRVPVWATKVQITEDARHEKVRNEMKDKKPDEIAKALPKPYTWNNRPNDLYFASRLLSDFREQELNFFSIPIDVPADEWINAPLAYIASDEPLDLTQAQKDNLRRFVHLGGTLLFSPDRNNAAFLASAKKLAEELFPEYKVAPLPKEHALYNVLYDVSRFRFDGMNNGARDLVLISNTDLGKPWQSDENFNGNEIWKLTANLFTLVSDRGVLTNRLVDIHEDKTGKASDAFQLARVQYDGNWEPEPLAWMPVANRLANTTGIDLQVGTVKIEDLVSAKPQMAHLAGVEPVEFSDDQKKALVDYVKGGGTLLVETVGGRGTFSLEVDRQLRDLFGAPSLSLDDNHPIITGQGLKAGLNEQRVAFRRLALLNAGGRTNPRLQTFLVGDRPGVIFSHEDLSLGSLRARQYGISGYQADSARALLSNLIQYVKQKPAAATPVASN